MSFSFTTTAKYESAYFDYRFVKGQPANYLFISDHRDWSWHQDKGSAVGQPNIQVSLGYSIFYANSKEQKCIKTIAVGYAVQNRPSAKHSTNILHDVDTKV